MGVFMYYFYDGSFVGFLTLVYDVFLSGNYDITILKEYENSLFEGIKIETNNEKAKKVYDRLIRAIGLEGFDKIYTCFLSEEKGIELHLLNYIRLSIKLEKEINKHFLPETKKVESLYKKVNHEAHKFKGLLRFRKLKDNTYLAIISPSHNIIPLIKEHFIDRYNDQNFVIYDEIRKYALMFDSVSKTNRILPIEDFDERLKNYKNTELLHQEEVEYTSLWKGYFESINIKERENKKLQKQHIPMKYWDNLNEFKS